MQTWIAIVVPIAIFLADLVKDFFFRWVPNVEDQKRYVKMVLEWLWDIFSVAVSVWWLYRLGIRHVEVTPGFVLQIAVSVAEICLLLGMIFIRRMLRWFVEIVGRLLSEQLRLAEAISENLTVHDEALRIIAREPAMSAASGATLQQLLRHGERLTDGPTNSSIGDGA